MSTDGMLPKPDREKVHTGPKLPLLHGCSLWQMLRKRQVGMLGLVGKQWSPILGPLFFWPALPVHHLFEHVEKHLYIIQGPQLWEKVHGFLAGIRNAGRKWPGDGSVAAALVWLVCRPRANS